MSTSGENLRKQREQQAAFWLDYSHQLAASIRYSEALAAVERSLELVHDGLKPSVV